MDNSNWEQLPNCIKRLKKPLNIYHKERRLNEHEHEQKDNEFVKFKKELKSKAKIDKYKKEGN